MLSALFLLRQNTVNNKFWNKLLSKVVSQLCQGGLSAFGAPFSDPLFNLILFLYSKNDLSKRGSIFPQGSLDQLLGKGGRAASRAQKNYNSTSTKFFHSFVTLFIVLRYVGTIPNDFNTICTEKNILAISRNWLFSAIPLHRLQKSYIAVITKH